MSRARDPHRSFFPFGNPFRMISPKGSQMTPQLLGILNSFEATLAGRLKKLMPKNKDEILSISWMTLAMESLCETHNDIKTLALDIELPLSHWDEKWIDVYLDISVKLLDICIAFSSELSRLNQGHLLLQCALHNLNTPSPQQFVRACSSIDGWRHHVNTRNPRIDKCGPILDDLLGSLDLPKVKNSAKGKVLMRAMYGVKVETAFLCSVFAAFFSASAEKLLELDVADTYSWAQAFTSLRHVINEEIKGRFSNGRFAVLRELEAVDASVEKLYPIIQGELDTVGKEALLNTVEETSRAAERLSQGLDHLAKEVDGFFRVVLSGRDALLASLRSGATFCDTIPGGNMDEQRVK